MDLIKKMQGKMVDSKKVKQKLVDKQFQVGRNVLIKGLPATIKLGYKEQKSRGINPTVNSIFGEISHDNLEFYHKMNIADDYIKEVISKVINSIDKCI